MSDAIEYCEGCKTKVMCHCERQCLKPDSELASSSCSPPDWNNVAWRQLKKGERVERGDWVDMCRDGWRDNPKWVPATKIGERAPDPAYPAHRSFRRVL